MSEHSEANKNTGVSRRGFLKGLGIGTVATGLLPAGSTSEGAESNSGTLIGPGETSITLHINGQSRSLQVEPRVTLLDALRNRLDLTGAKKVCDRGTCGACTVLMEGQPIYSCSMLAMEAQGRKITTIEGLGTPENMSPVQKAFVKHDAQQCGFCTPGFVLACTSFLNHHPRPTEDEIRGGLGGNLCRCGTYAGIIEAVMEAAKMTKGAI